MANHRKKTIVMKSEPSKGMKIFSMIAGVAAFAALWYLLVSALPFAAARYAAAVAGVAVSAVYLSFGHKKAVVWALTGTVALYTALSVGVGFSVFRNGALLFWNGIAEAVNSNVHSGLSYASVDASIGAEFLFSSVLAAWLGFACAALCKRNRYVWLFVQLIALFVLFCAGLYPSAYSAAAFAVVFICLLVAGNGMSLKSALHWTACAAVVAGAALPCMVYAGSEGVRELQRSFVYACERAVYGGNDLPDGDLSGSFPVRESSAPRLEVTLTSHTPVLYLKGFAGGALTGTRWTPTDKNAYVSGGYQGLMDYLADGGITSLTQYARYSSLSGKNDRYRVEIKNTGAYRKYAYASYAVSEYSAGSLYYDLNLRGAGNSYAYTVFAGDEGGERTSQANWVTENSNRTEEMTAYLERESEYRAFVYETYAQIDTSDAELIQSALGGVGADSLNTVTQLARAYFLSSFRYAAQPDALSENFTKEFFGGGIARANAPYFASAAAQIFRSYGFAARYAEGYLVKGDFSGGESTVCVAATENDAHAWTEVYLDGVGWLPVEVTPGYFSDEDWDSAVDPEAPEAPEEEAPPAQPELPPEEQPEPDEPPVEPVKPQPQENGSALFTALKVLVPVLAVALAAAAAALFFAIRREIVLARKRKSLECGGEAFGRAAYSIMECDFQSAGGFSVAALEEVGIGREETERFLQIAERCVYGGFDPTANERSFVIGILEKSGEALLQSGEPFKRLRRRYAVCVGLK